MPRTTRKRCPHCKSTMTVEVGLIEETVYASLTVSRRKTRLGRFWSCWVCDHCEEDR